MLASPQTLNSSRPMKVGNAMTRSVHCLCASASLHEAALTMRKLNLGCLPVCDDEGLIGIVTDRDLVVRGLALGKDARSTPISEVMTPGIIYIHEHQTIDEAIQVMEQTQVRRLPVLNSENKILGILSLSDVARRASPELGGGTLRVISEQTVPFFESVVRTAEPAPRSFAAY